jgi:hypothetical protein
MTPAGKRGPAFWVVQAPGWMLLLYLVVAQGVTAFSYDLGVRMGTQESAETITEVGTAFWYGFALGDLLTYIPLLAVGLIGHLRDAAWSPIVLAGALGITVYWPVVCLAAVVDARGAAGWHLADETPFWIALPLIAAWGALGLWLLVREAHSAHQVLPEG